MLGRTPTHCVLEGIAEDRLGVRDAMRGHHDGSAVDAMDTMATHPVHGNNAEQRGDNESKAIGLHQ